jgi:hypothetical protein
MLLPQKSQRSIKKLAGALSACGCRDRQNGELIRRNRTSYLRASDFATAWLVAIALHGVRADPVKRSSCATPSAICRQQ